MALALPLPAPCRAGPLSARATAPSPAQAFAALGPKQQRVLAVLRDLCGDPTETSSPQSDELARALGVCLSTLYRHRKGLDGLAYFPANGYCSINEAGVAAVDAPPALPPSRTAPESCPRCAAARLSAPMHAGAAMYACGRIVRWAGLAWIPTGWAGCCPGASCLPRFADGATAAVGAEIRLCDRAARWGAGANLPSRQKPALGRVTALAGGMALVEPHAAPGIGRPYPAHALILVGAGDPSGLSPHQKAVAEGLRAGRIVIESARDGGRRLAPAAGAGNAVLSGHPSTLPALVHSGVIDDVLAKGPVGSRRVDLMLAAAEDPLPAATMAALDGLIAGLGADRDLFRIYAAFTVGGAFCGDARSHSVDDLRILRGAVVAALAPLARRYRSDHVIVTVDPHHAAAWGCGGTRLLACRHRGTIDAPQSAGLLRLARALPDGDDATHLTVMPEDASAHQRMLNAKHASVWNEGAGWGNWTADVIDLARLYEGDPDEPVAVRVTRSGPGALVVVGDEDVVATLVDGCLVEDWQRNVRWRPHAVFAAVTEDLVPTARGIALPPAQAEAWHRMADGPVTTIARSEDVPRVRAGVIEALATKGLVRRSTVDKDCWMRVGAS